MTDSENGRGKRAADRGSRPLFDPARERAIERERARERRDHDHDERERRRAEAGQPTSGRIDRTESTSTPTSGSAAASGESNAASTVRGSTESRERRTMLGESTAGSESRSRFASASDVTRRGVGFTLVTGLLAALGYYGVLGVQEAGVQAFGTVVPAPFYALTFSVLFVFSLVPRAHGGLPALTWSILFSLVFGTLLAIGTEGAFYLADNPDVATAGYTGLTVLALAVVVAAIAYWGVLSVAKTA
jgi:hypothetical protein